MLVINDLSCQTSGAVFDATVAAAGGDVGAGRGLSGAGSMRRAVSKNRSMKRAGSGASGSVASGKATDVTASAFRALHMSTGYDRAAADGDGVDGAQSAVDQAKAFAAQAHQLEMIGRAGGGAVRDLASRSVIAGSGGGGRMSRAGNAGSALARIHGDASADQLGRRSRSMLQHANSGSAHGKLATASSGPNEAAGGVGGSLRNRSGALALLTATEEGGGDAPAQITLIIDGEATAETGNATAVATAGAAAGAGGSDSTTNADMEAAVTAVPPPEISIPDQQNTQSGSSPPHHQHLLDGAGDGGSPSPAAAGSISSVPFMEQSMSRLALLAACRSWSKACLGWWSLGRLLPPHLVRMRACFALLLLLLCSPSLLIPLRFCATTMHDGRWAPQSLHSRLCQNPRLTFADS